MTLRQSTLDHETGGSHVALRLVAVTGVLVALLLVLTAIIGVGTAGPSYEIAPDPAGVTLPF